MTTARDALAWTYADQVQQPFGDSGFWVGHLATAWQACAIPGVGIPLPEDPTDRYVGQGQSAYGEDGAFGELRAYWAPLLHLLCFGLGWARPDLGLTRWLQQGAPTEDPILKVVHRWWGERRLTDFVAWTAWSQAVLHLGQAIAAEGNYRRFDDRPIPDAPAPRVPPVGEKNGARCGLADRTHCT